MRRRILSSNKKKEDYLTFTATSSGTFKFSRAGLSYSTDGSTWTTLAANTNTPTIAAGQKIYFKGTLTPSSGVGIGAFSSTVNFTASGTPMSLLFGDDFKGQTSLSGKSYAFFNLFDSCSKLTSIDDLLLPATTLAFSCYQSMFKYCTGLTSIPTDLLPATTLVVYCYRSMFQNCTNITTAPKLPATTLADSCYNYMFYECSNLNYVECSATSWNTNNSNGWLNGVASTGTFVGDDYTIGYGTSRIPITWDVQSTHDYSSDYLTILSLDSSNTISFGTKNFKKTIYISTDNGSTWTAKTSDSSPTTLATLSENQRLLIRGTNDTYGKGDTAYNYIMAGTGKRVFISGNILSLFYGSDFIGKTELPDSTYSLSRMFASMDKTLIRADNLILPTEKVTSYCYNNMFNNAYSMTHAPKELPATTSAVGCYMGMFMYCSGIKKAPVIRLSSLSSSSCTNMFNGCTSLKYIKAMFITGIGATCCSNWVKNVWSTGTYVKNSEATYTLTGVNGIPEGWTVETASS